MAIDIKEPAVTYPVGRAKGENFFTIAKKHKIGANLFKKSDAATSTTGQ